ncbi:MAG: Na/Pi cotransporter family protein [Clostridia bacterium]|nr:Na/Pi cotransporter family protein [Clostridia bacterium]
MGLFEILNLIGGLSLFLFGMNLMGQALEKRAGNKLKNILSSMTSTPIKGFFLGLAVTAVIQSSSATTVMVVGFVNSGLMTLKQSVGIIMGSNIGTTVTAWILSLSGIDGDALWVQLLKPTSFTPILALIGIIFYMFQKNPKRKDTGMIMLGFAVLMFGMDAMSGAVSGLKDNPEFASILTLFSNPILGVLAGAVVTAIVQSSSASVGILQALSTTGQITFNAAIPIIMGQNIGTCVSAVISSVGASKNAKRTAMVHLLFNIVATLVLLPIYCIVTSLVRFDTLYGSANELGIAVAHSTFNVLAVIILMPCSSLLVNLACKLIKEDNKNEVQLLDERLLATPSVAVERCKTVAKTMADVSVKSFKEALTLIDKYDAALSQKISEDEDSVDMYEDKLGSYLVKISSKEISSEDSNNVNTLLHLIGDFERISDHAMNIAESAEEIHDKDLAFSPDAKRELSVVIGAINEILDLSLHAFCEGDLNAAVKVEPLEQVVDDLRDKLKKKHIARLQRNECTIEMGFILSDILANLERISDHCSNIAGCLIEMAHEDLDIHEYLRNVKDGNDKEFKELYEYYQIKYSL